MLAMSIKRALSAGEVVILDLRTHVKALFLATLVLIVTLAAATFGFLQVPSGDYQQWIQLAIGVVAAIVIVLWAVIPYLRWSTTRYVVTNKRLITRSGIITRIGRDIPLYRINDVTYEKDILDRILGCGTIVISDATEKTGVMLYDVPRVDRVQVRLHELLFSADDGSDDGEFPPTEPRRR